MPDKVRIHSARELEAKAENYLSRAFGSALAVPIDVDYLIEKIEGLDLDYYPKLQANHKVLGGVWRDVNTGNLFIYIDEDHADDDSRAGRARYRFTVAEELAHVCLHRELIEAVKTPSDFRALHQHLQWKEIERNAKRFAAAILMPPSALSREAREVYEQIVGRPEIHPHVHRIDAAERWSKPIRRWLCEELARRFEVSNTSMEHRLNEWPAKIYDRVDRSLSVGADSLL